MIEDWLLAATRGDVEAVAEGLRRGIDVDTVRPHRQDEPDREDESSRPPTETTALWLAVRHRHLPLIRLLLDHGARSDLKGSIGITPMTWAVLDSRSWEDKGGWILTPDPNPGPLQLLLDAGRSLGLVDAALLDDLPLALRRLDEGADVDEGEGSYRGPVLTLAAAFGHRAIVQLLLDRGANIHAYDDTGTDAVMAATYSGWIDVVRLLLDRGATPHLGLLADAAQHGHADLVHALIARNFDLHAVDRWDSKTPLAWAVERGRDDIAAMLRRAGADR